MLLNNRSKNTEDHPSHRHKSRGKQEEKEKHKKIIIHTKQNTPHIHILTF
jgi:hypothetical protein